MIQVVATCYELRCLILVFRFVLSTEQLFPLFYFTEKCLEDGHNTVLPATIGSLHFLKTKSIALLLSIRVKKIQRYLLFRKIDKVTLTLKDTLNTMDTLLPYKNQLRLVNNYFIFAWWRS